MADRRISGHAQPHQPARPGTTTVTLHRIPPQSHTSTRFVGLLTLPISSGVLLLLTGITVTATLMGLVVFGPLILLTSPIWVPVAAMLFIPVFGLLCMCGVAIAALSVMSWLYKYFKGSNPPGSDQAEYARRRIVDTARNVKEYARDYGGYLRTKLKDVAPGA